MLGPKEVEQIIKLIDEGHNLKLLSFELEIPIEQLQDYKKQLELKGIDQLLKELNPEEPIKRKASNLRKKKKQRGEESQEQEASLLTESNMPSEEIATSKNYKETIKRYQEEIARNPKNSSNKRNLLAFAYFKSGQIESARDELLSLIEERGSYMAYRQLIYLEKCEGNFEDAKMWGTACLEQFPNDNSVRHQLIAVAQEEKDTDEIIRQLREIIKSSPEDEKSKKILASILEESER